ncbi:histone-lysine N-methyltransferase SETD2 isoform X2 [Arapaima gigas]
MDALVETEIREGGGEAMVKEEILTKSALLKNLPTKGLLSSRLLPKGTKSKVNLEEQGRQKVSFSFSQTKKPLQNLFLSQLTQVVAPSNCLQIGKNMVGDSPVVKRRIKDRMFIVKFLGPSVLMEGE